MQLLVQIERAKLGGPKVQGQNQAIDGMPAGGRNSFDFFWLIPVFWRQNGGSDSNLPFFWEINDFGNFHPYCD